jgi:hypothetical protein
VCAGDLTLRGGNGLADPKRILVTGSLGAVEIILGVSGADPSLAREEDSEPMMTTQKVVDICKAIRELGYTPSYGLRGWDPDHRRVDAPSLRSITRCRVILARGQHGFQVVCTMAAGASGRR